MNNVIILNRMYAGGYLQLQNTIGHEVINLFKSDNDKNYLYINHDGRINPIYNDSVEAVLLVKYVEAGVMEVIAKAEHLEQVLYKIGNVEEECNAQIAYIRENDIRYGGVYPYEVHENSLVEKTVITFKSNKVMKVLEPIYLIEDSDKIKLYDRYYFLPEKHFSSQSLKMYYPKEDFPKDYEVIQQLLNDNSVWENENTTEKLNINDYKELKNRDNFLSIIKKEYDELVYSNMLAFFFEQNREVFIDFTKEVLGVDSFNIDFDIIRESNDNIDLWIEDKNSVIVIENKIKSKVNGEKHDIYSEKIQSQLKKYYEFTYKERPNKKKYFYVFSPDYNRINLSKYDAGNYYNIINYSQIRDFYKKYAGEMLHVNYFCEFVDALDLHSSTKDNLNYEIMKSRFITAIQRVKEIEKHIGE